MTALLRSAYFHRFLIGFAFGAGAIIAFAPRIV